jgi:hypothetical protein
MIFDDLDPYDTPAGNEADELEAALHGQIWRAEG